MKRYLILGLLILPMLACKTLLPDQAPTRREPVIAPVTLVMPTSTPRPTAVATIAAPQEGGFTLVRLHPEAGNLNEMLAVEAEKAAALGQIPVVEFDASWCPPCQAINQSLDEENELMLAAFAGTYIIRLDVDEWGWDLTEYGFAFDGIPVYFKLDEKGRPNGEVIDGNAWGENSPENMAPPLDEFFHAE